MNANVPPEPAALPTADSGFRWTVSCLEPGCGQPAEFKVASRWSDGITTELKTYGLVCRRCLPAKYATACEKQSACSRAEREMLAVPTIFRLAAAGSAQLGMPLLPAEVAALLAPMSPA